MRSVLAALMNATQVEARDVSSQHTRRPPRPPAPSPGNRRRPILSRQQHTAASHVDKRSAALLTRPAGAEQSLFFALAAPPSQFPPPHTSAALFYCRLCLFDISRLLLSTENRHLNDFLGPLPIAWTSLALINSLQQTFRGKL